MKKGQYLDISGRRFGRLTALERTGNQKSRSLWRCSCSCGKETVASISNLLNGHTRSCGCLVADANIAARRTHGGKGKSHYDRLYNVWRAMKQRCFREKTPEFKWYGALGVSVCEEWKNSYTKFREWSMANGYDQNAKRGECTLDRIDPYGNYEPGNCRWVDMHEQAKNKRKGVKENEGT